MIAVFMLRPTAENDKKFDMIFYKRILGSLKCPIIIKQIIRSDSNIESKYTSIIFISRPFRERSKREIYKFYNLLLDCVKMHQIEFFLWSLLENL